MKKIELPLGKKETALLKAGDRVLLSGTIYTARDAAHKRMVQGRGYRGKGTGSRVKRLPFDIKDQVIYYAGPSPAAPGMVIGSCGPTTSSRMDAYTPGLLGLGLGGMIGKGSRSREVISAVKKYGAVYFIAIGGAGAFYSEKIISAKIIAYRDLGPEAIYKLEIENFPVIVGIDSRGRKIGSRR